MSQQTDLFDSLLADIIVLTNRPDLEDESHIALRAATRNAHFSDFYPRDCQISSIQLPSMGYTAQLDVPSLFPMLRGIDRIQLLDAQYLPVSFTPESQIQVAELGDIYDDFGRVRNNIAFLAGSNLNVRSILQGYGLLVTWFKSPQTKRELFDSWIAQEYPEVITFWAASIVLDTSGNEAKAQKYLQLVQNLYIPAMKSNFLLGAAR